MTSTENLNHASLTVDTEIVSTQTGEHGSIRSLAGSDGMITVKITTGPDAGDYISMSPAEIITYWRKIPAEPQDSHAVATVTLTEEDLIEERLPIPAEFDAELADEDVFTVDMIDTSRRHQDAYTHRCLRATGAYGEYGIALLGICWPLAMRAGQRVDLIALRREGGAYRLAVHYSTS